MESIVLMLITIYLTQFACAMIWCMLNDIVFPRTLELAIKMFWIPWLIKHHKELERYD